MPYAVMAETYMQNTVLKTDTMTEFMKFVNWPELKTKINCFQNLSKS